MVAVLTLTATGIYADSKGEGKNHNFAVARNLETFSAIYKSLDMMYVDTLDADVTVGYGINAMLHSLDPYTEYYPASDMKDLKQMLTGKYAGIGALIKKDLRTGQVVIDELYEGMPAAEAGLRKGDVILAVDDTSMVDKEVAYVSSHLRGEPGTTFLLKVKRVQGGSNASLVQRGAKVKRETLKIKITRRAIQLPSVPYYGMINDSVGYVVLTQFTEDCSRDVRRALIDMRGKGMKGLVFDLRGNGGGALQEAIEGYDAGDDEGQAETLQQGVRDGTGTARHGDAHSGAGKREFGIGKRDNGRVAAGPRQGGDNGYEDVRQGTGAADGGPAARRVAETDGIEILHTERQMHTGCELQTYGRGIQGAYT